MRGSHYQWVCLECISEKSVHVSLYVGKYSYESIDEKIGQWFNSIFVALYQHWFEKVVQMVHAVQSFISAPSVLFSLIFLWIRQPF